ncbi:MAG: DUF4097 domain-containing protein [Intrasporangium sp.]|uniref:DUF4097 family beta strand repeat-containing protein n=1 Tax=Intrasporangium sp. TaxID=1925024 RepID=UPI002646FEB1|nr:DUF4097 family beta strand repeat-containing protein [Intrasporangium sp.]MDN5798143.1 DUF4097 domain-containing protein [Intrasporangium sp.]
MEHTFHTPGPIRLRVELVAGDVAVRATETDTTTVQLTPRGPAGEELAERFTVEQRGDEVVVLAPKMRDAIFSLGKGSVDIGVTLPPGSVLDAKTGSGDIEATGLLDRARAATGSGDVTLDEFAGGDLRSGSGDLSARVVRGDLALKTGSGDVSVGTSSARVDLVSGSGDVTIRRADGPLKAKTGSGDLVVLASSADLDLTTGTGDVTLVAVHAGEIRAKTGTGDVVAGIAHGVATYLDLNTVTGDVDVDLDEATGPEGAESTALLHVQSGSGDIHVKRAQVSLS